MHKFYYSIKNFLFQPIESVESARRAIKVGVYSYLIFLATGLLIQNFLYFGVLLTQENIATGLDNLLYQYIVYLIIFLVVFTFYKNYYFSLILYFLTSVKIYYFYTDYLNSVGMNGLLLALSIVFFLFGILFFNLVRGNYYFYQLKNRDEG